jgi:omega-amidase
VLKIFVAQIQCDRRDPCANVRKMTALCAEAARRECRVVLFPELSDTGYDLTAIGRLSSGWHAGPLLALREAARGHGVWIIAGLSERARGNLYNSLAVVDSRGRLAARYRKKHLCSVPPNNEEAVFVPGRGLVTCAIGGHVLGLSICFDLRFPALYQGLARKGATVLVNAAAWPAARISHWDTLLRARAIENQCYAIGVNRAGSDGPLRFGGRSCVIEPQGVCAWVGSGRTEDLGIVEIDPRLVTSCRKSLPMQRESG